MKRFEMHRREDDTGISGTGHIADGVVFDDGLVVIHWRTATPGTTVFSSLDDARAVHGHEGKTGFVFRDQAQKDEPEIFFCSMCFATCDIAYHCFNCGAGGTNVSIPQGHAELIRKSASWVGSRYYPSDEDKVGFVELRELRRAVGSWPSRTVEPIPDSDRVWVKQQLATGGWTMISCDRLGETDEQVIRRTAHLLPYVPPTVDTAPVDATAGIFSTTVRQVEQ